MNRRSFVKKLGLLCLVPFVPKVLLSNDQDGEFPIPKHSLPIRVESVTYNHDDKVMVPDSGSVLDKVEKVYFDGDHVFFNDRRVFTDGVRFIVK